MKKYGKVIIFGIIEILYFVILGKNDIQFSFILWTILSVFMLMPYLKDGKKVDLGDGGIVGRGTLRSSTYSDRMYGKKMAESVASSSNKHKYNDNVRKEDISLVEYIWYGYALVNGIGFIVMKFIF